MLAAVLSVAASGVEHTTVGYRGPQNNGVYPARGLLKSWPPGGPLLLWKQMLGIGYAGATVVDDRVYITGGGGTSFIHVFDLEQGQTLIRMACGTAPWARFSGTRASPLVSGGVLLTILPNADIYAVELDDQSVRWQTNAWKNFGTGKGRMGWGVPETPMLLDNRVIFNTCSRDNQTPPLVALDLRSGETVWQMDPETDRNFSASDVSGASFTHNGRKLLAVPTWRSFLVLDGLTGKKLWEFPDPKGSSKNLAPIYNDGYLLTMPQGSLCRMVKLSDDGANYTPLWERAYRGGFGQAVILDGRVYIFGSLNDRTREAGKEETPPPPNAPKPPDRPAFLCLDALTGEVVQSYPCAEAGHIAAADGMIYMVEILRVRRGQKTVPLPRVRLLRPRPAGFEITGEFVPNLSPSETALRDIDWEANACPTIAEGRLFLRFGPLLCYDLRAEPPACGFRGDGTGVNLFAHPPDKWTLDQNVLWSCDLPAVDASPPVPSGERLYLAAGGKVFCLDAATGRIIWEGTGGKTGDAIPPPVPVVCGGSVYAAFHDGQVGRWDREGRPQWSATVVPHDSGRVASPLLCDDVLVVQGKELTGLSAETGEKLWAVPFPEGLACGTPVKVRLNQYDGRDVVVTSCGMLVVAADGRVLNRYNPKDGLPAVTPVSPVLVDSRALFCANRPDDSGATVCWSDLETPEGNKRAKTTRIVKTHKGVTLAGSPLIYRGLGYSLTDKQELITWDDTGALVQREGLVETTEPRETPAGAELLAAGGYIYAVGLGTGNEVVVLRPGRKPEIVRQIILPDAPVALAFERDRLYVRTGKKLYALGMKDK